MKSLAYPLQSTVLAIIFCACGPNEPGKTALNPDAGGLPESGHHPAESGVSAPDAAQPAPDSAPVPPMPDDCITDVEPGYQQLECDGLVFHMNVPESCLSQACGLIFDVHGFGMDGTLQDGHTQLRELAGAEGYIVVNPSAPGQLSSASWNASHDASVFALMQRVISVWHVDEKRIHFGGYSQGGWMTWRFICQHADLIASAAPIAAGAQGATGCFSGDQLPSEEIPIFYTHGTTDGLVRFETAIPQRDAVISAWNLRETEVVGSDADYQWTRYENDNGTVFEFAQHDWECAFTFPVPLLGHCFPGSPEFLGCGADNAFHWGQAVLAFYKSHPKP